MAVRVECGKCDSAYQAVDAMEGRDASCPNCGACIDVPIAFDGMSEADRLLPVLGEPNSPVEAWEHRNDQSSLPLDDQSSLTLDDSARASNPGNLSINPVLWLNNYPLWPIIWFGCLVLCALGCFVHWWAAIGALLLVGANLFYWQRVREHFLHGCANPGLVVSLNPMLIAVTTDLTKGIGEYPVVKVFKKELPTICGQTPKIGSKVASVALYSVSEDEELPHWEDFDPRPVDCVSGDIQAIQRVLDTFSQDDWKELEMWLHQVPKPYRPGLFHVKAW